MSEQAQELTYGQKAVGVRFNPSGKNEVDEIKDAYASLIDQLNNLRNSTDNSEKKRQYSVAITEAQTSQMWAVKAVTWQY